MKVLECHSVSYLPLTSAQLKLLSPVWTVWAVVVGIEDRLVGGAQAEVTQSAGRVHHQDRRGQHLR
jgi:hypothetical protein